MTEFHNVSYCQSMTNTPYLTTRLGQDGRLVIPAKVRRHLDLKGGKKLHLYVKSHQIVIKDPVVAWRKFQDSLKPFHYKPGQPLLSEQLIEERRQEAFREQKEP